jgi:hypothetical protein
VTCVGGVRHRQKNDACGGYIQSLVFFEVIIGVYISVSMSCLSDAYIDNVIKSIISHTNLLLPITPYLYIYIFFFINSNNKTIHRFRKC